MSHVSFVRRPFLSRAVVRGRVPYRTIPYDGSSVIEPWRPCGLKEDDSVRSYCKHICRVESFRDETREHHFKNVNQSTKYLFTLDVVFLWARVNKRDA